ncbi:MAG TPA: integrase core domain-containing protein, partial [Chloroflexota bacterium]|nr:integrase core domain-containing protein [Chloroflexota bacterium]
LKWLSYYENHDHNVSLTCRYFGISRQTFYRWKRRYNPRDLSTLEDRPSSPKKRRGRTWSTQQVEAVRKVREEYPRWGKEKLKVILEGQKIYLSVSMVGRILSYLKGRRVLREPIRAIKTRQRRWKRPYGVRKPKDYPVVAPGDLVQMDTMDVRPEPGAVLKQFTTRDVVSRWDVLELACRATAATAARLLDTILERIPFKVKAFQVDGGSEFMAEFEEACQARGIRLFVLPPRSPKLNGAVERANRTHTEEFYHWSAASATVGELGPELRAWETIYNTVRPHQALGYLTPKQFLDQWYQQHPREEVLSRTL